MGKLESFPIFPGSRKTFQWIGSGGTGPDRFPQVTSGFYIMVQGPLVAGHLQGPIDFTTQLDHLLSLVNLILNQALIRLEVFAKAFVIIFSFRFLQSWFHRP